ncbi:MAG: hypothetical protein QNI84_06125 [Henriciella sp.]|nr:hypothetical protein [Henriciella sp.]
MNDPEKIAVIDVGSNSCRLVIYERQGNAILPYFNEKMMAGLGRSMSKTGMLSVDGRRKALETFRRFSAILNSLGIDDVHAVATSAVREAKDSVEFCELAEEALGKPLRILSGADEGRISARGVMMGFGASEGLVADLGGSSVELKRIEDKDKVGESYLLGPLAREADADLNIFKRREIIAETLQSSKILTKHRGELYIVGGAWRNLAAVHMMLKKQPLRVIHSYGLSRKGIQKVIEAVQGAAHHSELRERIQRVAKRRYDTLLHSALVLDVILEASKSDRAYVSAYGLREGVVSEALDLVPRKGLRDAVRLYLKLSEDSSAFGAEMFNFVEPVAAPLKRSKQFLRATCLMADAGARMHPDHRPDLVFEHILRAPFPRLSHPDRIFAAIAVASRYTFKFQLPPDLQSIVSKADFDAARLVGTAMRLGGVYSGRSAKILKTAKLSTDNGSLIMRVLKSNEDMIFGSVKRRHRQLSGLMEREPVLELCERF